MGWLFLLVIVAVQPWGYTAADTKLDLALNPLSFLQRASHAWTDIFPLGQLQNQAYGYFFPQGPFFVLTNGLPDWIAQRLWWLLVLGIGYSGFIKLLQRLALLQGPRLQHWAVLVSLAFALSPRTLTTLTAISSETWPYLLSPWVVWAFLGPLDTRTQRLRAVATGIIPVACMGAVNATATLAACVPAGIVLLWRWRTAWPVLLGWLVGCAAVCAWWIVPLFTLGRYAPPFTDFIESATVTTRWLTLPEMLRGATSWTPFVDTERAAGHALTAEPVFILLTCAVTACGLAGLAILPRAQRRGMWVMMLLVGIVIMGSAHGPLGAQVIEFLDGPGAPLRNVHKFEPLLRLPLLVGVAGLVERIVGRQTRRRQASLALVAVVLVTSFAPAWAGNLLPRGAWEEVPGYWYDAAAFLNEEAAATRTLIYPERSFARADWGWTRDEPLQPLLDVPWAVRDAVPLVDPEAVRGLDGLMTLLREEPAQAPAALASFGIGAVVSRDNSLDELPGRRFAFGPLTVILVNPSASLRVSSQLPLRVAGGGEVVPLLQGLVGTGPVTLVEADAEIVTDTPALADRNMGTLERPLSAYLTADEWGEHGSSAAPDYPSIGTRVGLGERGGTLKASSSAADADVFGGARPERSPTAAVDHNPDTAWHPAPGATAGEWLELSGSFSTPIVRVTVPAAVDVTLSTAAGSRDVRLEPGRTNVITLPGGPTERIRLTLRGPGAISEISVEGTAFTRAVTVPDTSPHVRAFFFQRLIIDEGPIRRIFTTPRQMTLVTSAAAQIDGAAVAAGGSVSLEPGEHEIVTEAPWIWLAEPTFTQVGGAAAGNEGGADPLTRPVGESVLLTGRSYNPGLAATWRGVELEPRRVDSGLQAFTIPRDMDVNVSDVRITFRGDETYRAGLLSGGAVSLGTLLVAIAALLVLPSTASAPQRHRARRRSLTGGVLPRGIAVVAGTGALTLAIGWSAPAVVASAWLIRRFTMFPVWSLAATPLAVVGMWLARSPWPANSYAGGALPLEIACALAVAFVLLEAAFPRVSASYPPVAASYPPVAAA